MGGGVQSARCREVLVGVRLVASDMLLANNFIHASCSISLQHAHFHIEEFEI